MNAARSALFKSIFWALAQYNVMHCPVAAF
jgi:hypothetical protein